MKHRRKRMGDLGFDVMHSGCKIIRRKNRGMVAGCYDSKGHFKFRSAKTFRA